MSRMVAHGHNILIKYLLIYSTYMVHISDKYTALRAPEPVVVLVIRALLDRAPDTHECHILEKLTSYCSSTHCMIRNA